MTGAILIVGGYGVVGSRVAADLAIDFPGRVIVAGRHLESAQAAAIAIGHGVRGRHIDVGSPEAIASALDGISVAVNCIDQPERGLMWAAIERGLAYADITPHLTALGRGAAYERIDVAAKASGARILLGAGMVPGISSVMVRALAEMLGGGAPSIETALLLSANDLTGPASFDYLLKELVMPFDVHIDGQDRPAQAYTDPRSVVFPDPIGARTAYLFPFSDQVLYPRTMGARTVTTRLAIDPSRTSRLLSTLVGTGAVRMLARPHLRAALARLRRRRRPAEPTAPYALRVDVRTDEQIVTATLTGHGQANATATGTAALVHALADGQVAEPGAWMPEQVIDPRLFFDRIAARGLHVALGAVPPAAGQAKGLIR